MAETAAHLVDYVFPPLPVRRWVLSLPKRLHYCLKSNPVAVSAVLRILLRVSQQELVNRCPDAHENTRLGAVSFIHRCGDAFNEHIHFHCCVIDALSHLDNGVLRISELPTLGKADIAALMPSPRLHRHRYHGVLAPNSPLRDQVTALVPETVTDKPALASGSGETDAPDPVSRSSARYLWATLITRLFE